MKRIKLFILAGLMLLSIGGTALLPAATSADTTKQSVCKALGSNGSCTTNGGGGSSISDVFKLVVNVLSVVAGAVAVIMIVVAGFRFVTSGGDSNSVSAARNTIVYAIVGLIVVALAQVIVRFVLHKLGNGTVSHHTP